MKRSMQVLVWSLMLVLLVNCGGTASNTTEKPTKVPAALSTERLTFAGSTTVQPLAELLKEEYIKTHPGIEMEIGAGGSRVGIQAVQTGNADIGMASRDLKEGEQTEGMEAYQIAIDVLAMIVHPSNSMTDLSLEQLKDIYTGKITNWSEVGGPDLPILAAIRDVSSGTRGAFDDIVLGDESPIETEENTHITAGEVQSRVIETPGAIGYVGFGHIDDAEVKVISIDGVMPSPESAMDGSYKLKRPLLMLTGPLSRPQATEFIQYVLSDEGQQIVEADGWVPVAAKSP